ncbi:hypothetical protein, partial [Streptomyces spiralis]
VRHEALCLYPRLSREELGRRFLGRMTYPEPKGEGDNSMSGNQWLGSVVRDGVLGGPRDMAKTGLFEAQSPEDASSHPPERQPKPAPHSARGFIVAWCTSGVRSDVQRGHSRR